MAVKACLTALSVVQFRNKMAVITGGAGGIGLSIARTLAANSFRVCLIDINETAGLQALNGLLKDYGPQSAMFLKCDIANEDDLRCTYRKISDRFGHIKVVCNNAGISDEVDWMRMVDVNLKSLILNTKIAFEFMSKTSGGSGGSIVNISSAAGLYPVPYAPVYSATKAGVVAFTKSLKLWKDEYGISVSCLCPTYVNTPMLESLYGSVDGVNEVNELGVLSSESVAEAVWQIIQDPSLHGEVRLINKKNGTVNVKLRVITSKL